MIKDTERRHYPINNCSFCPPKIHSDPSGPTMRRRESLSSSCIGLHRSAAYGLCWPAAVGRCRLGNLLLLLAKLSVNPSVHGGAIAIAFVRAHNQLAQSAVILLSAGREINLRAGAIRFPLWRQRQINKLIYRWRARTNLS